jgi:Tat protein secretion system quality control protein TatD with DNase activity
VIESDSPDFKPADYLSVIPGLNDPGSLPNIAASVAVLRGETAEQVLETSRRNLIQLFQLNGLDTGAQVR